MVYEMEVDGLKLRRRVEDGRIHVTQVIRAIGEKTRSEGKTFKSAISTIGGIYAGTWVEVEKAWSICEARGLAESFYPILRYDMEQLEGMEGRNASEFSPPQWWRTLINLSNNFK